MIRPALLDHLRTVPEVSGGRAGIIGFCLGGGMAYLVAATSEPDVAVCYYGSAIPGNLDKAADVHCPVLFHFGDADEYITAEQRAAVEKAFAGRSHTEFHLHHGPNHAFDNHNAAMFHHPEAAAVGLEADGRIPGARVSGIAGQNLSAPRWCAGREEPARR